MIKTMEPSVKTFVVDKDAMVTADHDVNRVRVSECRNAECRNAECRSAECRSAECRALSAEHRVRSAELLAWVRSEAHRGTHGTHSTHL